MFTLPIMPKLIYRSAVFFFSIFTTTISSNYAQLAQWELFNFLNTGYSIDAPKSIKVTALGDIWVGTSNSGVFQFDGTATWQEYENTTTPTFPNNYINSISIYGNQIIAATAYNGVGKYSSGTWTTVTTANGLVNFDVRGAAYDASGALWYATDGGLSKEQAAVWTSYTSATLPTGMPTNHLSCIYIDPLDNKWVGTEGFGLLKLNSTWQTYTTANSSIPSNTITKIVVTPDDKLWICTTNGIALFDKNTSWTVYNSSNTPEITDNTINDIAIDNLGNIFLATPSGLFVRNVDGTWSSQTTTNSTLPENILKCVGLNSANGDLWVGTATIGIASISKTLVLTGSQSSIEGGSFNVYPNPVAEELTITLGLVGAPEKILLSLTDSYGKEMVRYEEQLGAHVPFLKQLSLSAFPAGVYSLRIEVGGESAVKKIIKY